MSTSATPDSIEPASAGRGRRRTLLDGEVIATVLTFGVGLVVNLLTGVLIARELGPDGRGAVTAAVTVTQVLAWACGFGSLQAISYWRAKHPEDAADLLASWSAVTVGLSVFCLVVGWVTAPLLLAAQPDSTLQIVRIFLFMAVFGLIDEVVSGMVLGAQDFRFFNLRRLVTPLVLLADLLLLLAFDAFTVVGVLVGGAAGAALSILLAVHRIRGTVRIGRVRRDLLRTTAAYGFRSYLTGVSQLVNARLDIFLLPAILSATQVGIYAVATSVSFIVATLGGAFAQLVLPAAAGSGGQTHERVVGTVRTMLAICTAMACLIGLVSAFGLTFIYGDDFQASVAPLLIMLPGCVLYSGATVLGGAISGLGRPLLAAATQGLGIGVTVIGLIVVLPAGGVRGAAVVSTITYTLVFVASVVAYRSCRPADSAAQATAQP